MLRITVFMLLIVALAPVTRAADHFTVTEIAPDLLLLQTDQGSYTNNSLVFSGPDGVLLVDTHTEDDADALALFVDDLGRGDPRYVINTHRHGEHIGGNGAFGTTPTTIAHHRYPQKLREGPTLFRELGPAFFPDITVADSLTLHFNGETIRVVDVGGCHDDNELMVHFVDRGVAHISSVVNGFNFPSVDSDGDVLAFARVTRQVRDLLPPGTRLISGHHGAESPTILGRWEQLADYAAMHAEALHLAREGLAAGEDLASMQEAGLLDRFAEYAGSYVDQNGWLEYLVEALENPRVKRTDAARPVYEVWRSAGATAAMARYREMVAHEADVYELDAFLLLGIGSQLLSRDLPADAYVFLEGGLELYPDHQYAYYANYLAATSCRDLGRLDEARRLAAAAVAAAPEWAAAVKLVEELAAAED